MYSSNQKEKKITSSVLRESCRHQQNHTGPKTGSMYQLEWALGTLKVGPSILPLSTSTLISSLFIQKAVQDPSSPAMKTPQPENISLKNRPHLLNTSVHLLTLDILVFRVQPLLIPSENVVEKWIRAYDMNWLPARVAHSSVGMNLLPVTVQLTLIFQKKNTLCTVLRLILPLGLYLMLV